MPHAPHSQESAQSPFRQGPFRVDTCIGRTAGCFKTTGKQSFQSNPPHPHKCGARVGPAAPAGGRSLQKHKRTAKTAKTGACGWDICMETWRCFLRLRASANASGCPRELQSLAPDAAKRSRDPQTPQDLELSTFATSPDISTDVIPPCPKWKNHNIPRHNSPLHVAKSSASHHQAPKLRCLQFASSVGVGIERCSVFRVERFCM